MDFSEYRDLTVYLCPSHQQDTRIYWLRYAPSATCSSKAYTSELGQSCCTAAGNDSGEIHFLPLGCAFWSVLCGMSAHACKWIYERCDSHRLSDHSRVPSCTHMTQLAYAVYRPHLTRELFCTATTSSRNHVRACSSKSRFPQETEQ